MARILFFVSSMECGGSERVAALLCNRWVTRGHEVVLVPTYSGRGSCFYELDRQVGLVFLADRVGTTRRTPISMARRLWQMRRLVLETRPDVVLSFLPHVNVATLVATHGLGIEVVVCERTYPPAMSIGFVWSLLRRTTYPWATRVSMQTAGGRDWLACEIPRASGVVIPNPCVFPVPQSLPRIEPDAIVPSGRPVLLAVGRLGEEKQFGLLIQAFAKLSPRFSDWHLVILGEGPDRNSLESQIAAAGLENCAHLPGRAGNVREWYDRADLYALSSRFEGFPNTLLEALAHGLPSVSLDCTTGPGEMVDEGVNGFLVPPEQGAEGLFRCLAKLMVDDTLRKNFSEHASLIRERFSIDKVGAQWDRALGFGDIDV